MFKVNTSMMVTALAVGVVLVALVTLVTAAENFVNCNDPGHHLEACDFGAICAWNRCNCREGKTGCTLVCQRQMKNWCNGQSEGDRCLASNNQMECVKCGRKLLCMLNPLGRWCSYEGNLYYKEEIFINSRGVECRCGTFVGNRPRVYCDS